MAKFVATGLSGLMLSLEELAKLPDEVIGEMLMAEGRVVERYQKLEIDKLKLVDKGRLKASIQLDPKYRITKNGKEYYINVYPRGEHHIYQGRRAKAGEAKAADLLRWRGEDRASPGRGLFTVRR